ncbi:plasmid transfer ATPase TraJ [Pseudomonas asuensis]
MRRGVGADRSFELQGEEYGLARGEIIRFRCNFIQARIAGLEEAYSITMRVIPTKLPNILEMDIEQDLFGAFFPGSGLVVVCGPTGSGKSTLLTANYVYAGEVFPDRKLITYEDPIEFVLGGEHWRGPQPAQSQIGRDITDFPAALKNAMRRKPSIIGIGELRDLPTVDAAVEASLTGHLCVGTLHTESAAETINRMIQVYPPAQQSSIASRLIGSLRVIVVQRLLKTTDGRRQAIREYVIFDRELRNTLQNEPPEKWSLMIRTKLEEQRATMADKAWVLYEQGRIDKAEYIELAGAKAFNDRFKEAL